MKIAFLTASLLALVSATALAVELFSAVSISSLTTFAGGCFGLGLLAFAIADYAPRRKSQLGRTSRRTIRRENAAPQRTPAPAATWAYQTISA